MACAERVRLPVLAGLFRELVLGRATAQPLLAAWLMSALCRWNLRLSVRDPELRRKLTPDYQAMCKRLSDSRPLLPGRSRSREYTRHRGDRPCRARGVVTADGTLHELDLLVLASGFDSRAYVRPMDLVGEHGLTLEEAWVDGPRAYLSVAVPGFPEHVHARGPAFAVRKPVAGDHRRDPGRLRHVVDQPNPRRSTSSSAAPTEVATKDYNEQMKADLPHTVWVTGCKSFYLGKDGLPVVFPWHPARHRELLRHHRVDDFDVRTA